MHLLFWLSLTPLSTAWLGEAGAEPGPAAAYAIVLLGCAIAFTLLTLSLLALHEPDSQLAEAIGSDRKGKVSLAVLRRRARCCRSSSRGSRSRSSSAVAVIWFVPDRRVERVLGSPELVGLRPRRRAALAVGHLDHVAGPQLAAAPRLRARR